MPKEGASGRLTLEEELDASSVFDPLQPSQGAEGPRTPPHYSETPTTIPPFDIAKVGMLPRMSPIMDQENALLNVAPGSPVRCTTPPGLDQGQGGSGHSSCSDSPMSLGSLAPGSSLALALKARTWPVTPSTFGGREGLPRSTMEEDEEEMDAAERQCQSSPRLNSLQRPPGHHALLGRILCSNERHALFGVPPNHTAHFTQEHGIHGQRTLVVHRRV